jgi:hypothetical protein
LGWLEFHTFNEAMLSTAEYLIRVPVTENDFKVAKRFLRQEARKAG